MRKQNGREITIINKRDFINTLQLIVFMVNCRYSTKKQMAMKEDAINVCWSVKQTDSGLNKIKGLFLANNDGNETISSRIGTTTGIFKCSFTRVNKSNCQGNVADMILSLVILKNNKQKHQAQNILNYKCTQHRLMPVAFIISGTVKRNWVLAKCSLSW